MEASGHGQRKGAAATACVGELPREEMKRRLKEGRQHPLRGSIIGGIPPMNFLHRAYPPLGPTKMLKSSPYSTPKIKACSRGLSFSYG